MKRENLSRNLEMATNVAILLVALLIVGTFAGSYFVRRAKPQLVTGLMVGQTFSPIQGVTYNDAPKTLVIAMSTNCNYCIASIPFYERLATEQRDNPATHIVSIFPAPDDEIKQFSQQRGLSIEAKSADFKSLGLSTAPTLLLLDRDGRLLNFWIGQLSPQGEAEVMKAVGNSTS